MAQAVPVRLRPSAPICKLLIPGYRLPTVPYWNSAGSDLLGMERTGQARRNAVWEDSDRPTPTCSDLQLCPAHGHTD